jgi:hypothetical protein
MKRYRVLSVVTTLIVIASASVYDSHIAARNLVQRSQPLVNVKGWWAEDTLDRPYIWLTETSLFSHSGWWRLSEPFTYNTSTHIKTPLIKLQKLLGSDGDDATRIWELAPDRRHIAWNIELCNTIHTANIDGREHKKWSIVGPGFGDSVSGLNWLADGHHWTASTFDYGNGKDRLACIGNTRDSTASLIGISHTGAESLALAQPVSSVEGRGFNVQSVVARRTVHISKLPYSSGAHIAELEASPNHEHLAWLIGEESLPPFARFLHRINPQYSVVPRSYDAIWISSIDGSDPREVGRIEVNDDDEVQFLQWMPNGTCVSYVYNDEVYAVDVRDCL